MTACDACLRRTWLVARLAGHIESAHNGRRRPHDVLALGDEDLLAAVGGRDRSAIAAELATIRPGDMRDAARRKRLDVVCRHDERYPRRLHFGPGAPAMLYVAGPAGALGVAVGERDGEPLPTVAIVGARKASPYGLEVARSLGRDLAAAGVTVVSGMALGIDSAAHAGAVEGGGPTVAVLAGGADVAYPASKRRLYDDLVSRQCVISEMPPGARPFRWTFPARNRTIAALSDVTVVVEAAERSGSLITADFAAELGREVAAVPGRVTTPQSRGTNALIVDGATLVRGARDVLDLLFGVGCHPPRPDPARGLESRLRDLLDAVESGRDSVSLLVSSPEGAAQAMIGLAELELLGFVRRLPGGRYGRVIA